MKKDDFIVWRYLGESGLNKSITRFGYLEKMETFHYVIRDAATGKIDRVLQSSICIIFDPIYTQAKNKNSIEKNLTDDQIKQWFINFQDEIGI